MDLTLKPCPFCGGEARVWPINSGGYATIRVGCKLGNCPGETGAQSTELWAAVATWNRRAHA